MAVGEESFSSLGEANGDKQKADSTLRSSQAVPHPSTSRALRRLTSEVEHASKSQTPSHSSPFPEQLYALGLLGVPCKGVKFEHTTVAWHVLSQMPCFQVWSITPSFHLWHSPLQESLPRTDSKDLPLHCPPVSIENECQKTGFFYFAAQQFFGILTIWCLVLKEAAACAHRPFHF